MKLAVFDIDGTLTETNEVDGECFVKAFASSHRISDVDTDWAKYNYVTDSGIFSEIFKNKFERSPSEQEILLFKNCFIKGLSEFADKDKTLFAEIPNAKTMLETLNLEKDWAITFATGCFYDSAELKLEKAHLNIKDFPIATADDAVSREEILQIAIEKSLKRYGQKEFEKIVSIGDAVWDARTAKNLKLYFIGVASGKHAELLRREGANYIIENFKDYEIFFSYLNEQ